MNIYYYSRSGHSAALAKALAFNHEVEAREIIDTQSYDGPIGFLMGGRAALSEFEDPILYTKPDSEPILLVFPVWAGRFPPAVRSFIKEVGREKLILVPTSAGSKLIDREGFRKIIDVVQKDFNKNV